LRRFEDVFNDYRKKVKGYYETFAASKICRLSNKQRWRHTVVMTIEKATTLSTLTSRTRFKSHE